jgi:hypothetical protein
MRGTDMDIKYDLTVSITRPIRPEELDPSFALSEHVTEMASPRAYRELEREVIQALRKLDGDCDAEVIDSTVTALGDCPTCDGYVLDASEAPYCPSCYRERQKAVK